MIYILCTHKGIFTQIFSFQYRYDHFPILSRIFIVLRSLVVLAIQSLAIAGFAFQPPIHVFDKYYYY